MKQRDGLVAVAAACVIAGCGAAQLALKTPISNQCASRGLKGCPELTDGVMEYLSGDKSEGEKKLRAGAAANSPEQLRVFATALEPIAANAGGDTGAALMAVIAILRGDAGTTGTTASAAASDGAGAGKSRAPARGADSARQPPNVVLEDLRAGTERPAADTRATTCGGIFGVDAKCTRARVFVGPLVVTNAYTSGGCPDELFLVAGRLDKPHWILLTPASAPMNVSGHFILEDGEELFAGARAVGAAARDDVKCSITWSGFRPLAAPVRKPERSLDE